VCAAPIELKWPNDVMVRSASVDVEGSRRALPGAPPWRKLAGILAEGASDGAVLRTVVVGIGLNVSRSPAPPEVAARMVALDELRLAPEVADTGVLVRLLVRALLTRLSAGVEQLSSGSLDEVRERWCALAPSVNGTPVRWHEQGVTRRGRAAGVDNAGALRVLTDDGEALTVHGGEVEWLMEGARA